jgi:predicted MFS family arabinose efflux permease
MMDRKTSARDWFAVTSVAFGTFALVTTEFLPIGLLPRIATDIHVSDGEAGLLVTIPGLVAAIAAPALVVGSGRLDRRHLLWLLSSLIIISNLIVAFGTNLPVLLVGRVLLGIGVGGFWAIGAALAGRMVAPDQVGRAMAIVFAGISVGTVLGVPAGALLGGALGWRMAFATAAGLGVFVLLTQILALPRLPQINAVNIRHLPAVFRVPQARIGLVAVVLLIFGHFMAYTYITPFLEQRAGAPPAMVSLLLLGYGAAGFVGNFVAGSLAQRHVRGALTGFSLMLGGAVILLPLAGTTPVSATILVVVWGLAFGGVPVCLQTWMFKAAPDLTESTGAVFICVLQLALAGGALLGGMVVDSFGLATTMTLAGIAALATAVVIRGFGRAHAAPA